MKRGGMYQRDSRETTGCLITALALIAISLIAFTANLIELVF